MNDPHNRRRRFMRAALATTGALACPWGLPSASAAASGRALIGFQVLPTWIRLLSALLTEVHGHYEPDLGTKVIIVPGGAGSQALEMVNRSPRDGAIVLISPSTVLTMTPALRKSSIDAAGDLIPIAAIGSIPFGFIVGPGVPAHVRTMSDYFAWVRANPASNSYGVPGLGTAPHYVGSEMSRLADVPMRAVGYKGSLALAEDVANGSVPAGMTVVLGSDEGARYAELRMLAVAGNRRLAHLPEIPTLAEAGFAESFPGESLGVFMPAGTPEPKVQQLGDAVAAALQTRTVTDAMIAAVIGPIPPSNEPYAAIIARERTTWRTLVSRHDFTGQG